MATETYIQVAPDSTGKQVRNLKVTVRDIDGTTGAITESNRYLQVVAITDLDGNPVDITLFEDMKDLMLHMLAEMRLQTMMLAEGMNLNKSIDPDALRPQILEATTKETV